MGGHERPDGVAGADDVPDAREHQGQAAGPARALHHEQVGPLAAEGLQEVEESPALCAPVEGEERRGEVGEQPSEPGFVVGAGALRGEGQDVGSDLFGAMHLHLPPSPSGRGPG